MPETKTVNGYYDLDARLLTFGDLYEGRWLTRHWDCATYEAWPNKTWSSVKYCIATGKGDLAGCGIKLQLTKTSQSGLDILGTLQSQPPLVLPFEYATQRGHRN